MPRARQLMQEAVAASDQAIDGAAMFYFMIQDYEEAVHCFRRGLALLRDRADAGEETANYMRWLAEALRKTDNVEEARGLEQAANEMYPQ